MQHYSWFDARHQPRKMYFSKQRGFHYQRNPVELEPRGPSGNWNTCDCDCGKDKYRKRFQSLSQLATPNYTSSGGLPRNFSTIHEDYQTSNIIASKESQRYGRKLINAHRQSFNYESVTTPSGRSSSICVENPKPSNRYRTNTQPTEDITHLYGSIQDNLTQCDKILLKLKGISQNTGSEVATKKPDSRGWIKQGKLSTSFVQKQPKPESTAHTKNTQVQDFTSQSQSHLSLSHLQVPPLKAFATKLPQIDQSQTLLAKKRTSAQVSESTILQLRRRRINEIIRNGKSSTSNNLDSSLARIKNRGQSLFSKMGRARESSIKDQYSLDQY